MRTAIIGLGMASPQHAQSLLELKDEVDVVAAFSPSSNRRSAFAERFGLPVVENVDVIFNDASIDYIIILTPPNTHLELVQRAADAGKHVLLEKPLDVTLDRSQQIVDIAARANIKLGVVFQRRFRRTFAETAKLLAEGELGEIVSVSMRLSNWRPQSYYDEPGRGTIARDGGGVLLTQAIHTIDQMITLAGLPAEVAGFAVTSAVHRMETEDLAHAIMRFENGAIGSLSATTSAYPGYPDEIEILGTKGSARMGSDSGTIALMDGRKIELTDSTDGGGTGADPMAFSHQNHLALHQAFLAALRDNREPIASATEALKAHRLIAAILQASSEGKTVAV
ncbi:gfo/Idh/MocA family oxidoreductase [Rhizobiales bacterium RZME27]|uniref:Gfo/Idh/MocA family oxidoreductase n=1 Tax=Endobacterium cereale TaxID=2663029 RepID=A0A6A8ACU2_9HYPH|nr:Gfo/Idh/MocA family oxidoreductase [Endobacterium cereale]MEB2844457.1 Gfo/Idh/MocA family oxidoreductase [Endobacterium cereale]MQY47046.1 gfo/Idh/MocA family oxidoreductase [Endobacterium cereale]